MFRWHRTTTSKTRYVGDSKPERKKYDASSDVFELVKEYASGRQKKSLSILDVGCSTGVAAAYMKKELSKMGISASVSGVDPALEVFKRAEQNLDKFYGGLIGGVMIKDQYDIVLCARLARFGGPDEQKSLIMACADRCAPDGAVITDGVLKTMHNRYHTVSKSRAAAYGQSLIQSWDSFGRCEFLIFRINLCLKRLDAKFWYEAKRHARQGLGRARRFASRLRPCARCDLVTNGVAGAGKRFSALPSHASRATGGALHQ